LTQNKKPWLHSWPLELPTHINYPDIPLHGLLEESAKHFPEKTAITCGDKEITFTQLERLSNQFANALIKLNVRKGDRVALFLPNTPAFVIAFFGILEAGAVVSTISPLYREREVEYQLSDSGAETIIVLDSLCPIAQAVKDKTRLKNLIVAGLDVICGGHPPSTDTSKVLQFQHLITQACAQRPCLEMDPNEDLAALQYTGGTTGTAKGAMLTHRNLVSNALAFAAAIRGTTHDTFLTALPLFHIYGMTTSMTVPISLGSKMVLLPKFEPAKVLDIIQRHKVTVFCGVPTMYQILLAYSELDKYDLKSIRVCISGASSLPPQVQRKWMEVTGGFLAEGYGLTEASPVTHCTPVDKSLPLKVGSIGLPLPDTNARIVDLETGESLEQGMVGELAVNGPQIMKGYWRNPEETALVLQGGWLLTGDIARIDRDGYFYITDRKKDLIKSKDYSVYPRELEDILYEHPAVKICAVIGKPDALAGEIPKAHVVLKEGATALAEEIMAFVNEKVAPYKAIREVEFRLELPLSGVGKVLRRVLKKK
jgi:long-chain acyl-CoA synthetase